MASFVVTVTEETSYRVEADNESQAEQLVMEEGEGVQYLDSDIYNVTVEEE